MPIPSRKTVADVNVVPLNPVFHDNYLPATVNSEKGVVPDQYYMGEVDYYIPQPSMIRQADTKPQRVRPKAYDIHKFLKGGTLRG